MTMVYQYSAIPPKSIRILSLNAGGPDDDICFKLECHELAHLPPFSALSYYWGDFVRGYNCFCEDASSYSTVSISQNLWSALRHLRRADERVEIWADQICIDQNNDQEKEEQIRLMESIYGQAKNVVVWLGEADEDTAMLFQHIHEVRKQIIHLIDTLGPGRGHNAENPHAGHYPLQLTSGNAKEWVAFRKLFSRPWFSRVWTFQELVLSKEALLICGPASIEWIWFYMVCACVTAFDRQGFEADSRLDKAAKVCEHMTQCWASRRGGRFEGALPEGKDQLRLLDLVFNLMKHKTSRPHDKVYGLLGVAEDVDAAKFPINYKQHFRDFYAQMTKHFIDQYADLSVLCLVNAGALARPLMHGQRNMPSWVPDYRFHNFQKGNLRVTNGPKTMLHGKQRLYNATGSSVATICDPKSLLNLGLQGVRVGTVQIVSESDGNTYTEEMLQLGKNVLTGGNWSQIAATCGNAGIYIPTGESVEQAFTRLRIMDCLPGEFNAERRQLRETSKVITEPLPDANMFERDDEIGKRIMTATFRQRLFVTGSGYIGLAHDRVLVGDEVYLLMGGHMPFILRRLAHGTFCYKGEAYVHGIMDGEHLVKHFKSSHVSDQDWLDGLAGAYSEELRTEVVVLS